MRRKIGCSTRPTDLALANQARSWCGGPNISQNEEIRNHRSGSGGFSEYFGAFTLFLESPPSYSQKQSGPKRWSLSFVDVEEEVVRATSLRRDAARYAPSFLTRQAARSRAAASSPRSATAASPSPTHGGLIVHSPMAVRSAGPRSSFTTPSTDAALPAG
jgi:hypothetical protein